MLVGGQQAALSLSLSFLPPSPPSPPLSILNVCAHLSLSPLPKLYCLNPGGGELCVYIYSHSLFSSNGRVPDEEGEKGEKKKL